jgi:putative transposase
MVSFRRNYVPGGTYFFTVTLRDRQWRMLTDHVDLLRAAFREASHKHAFTIDAVVILPEHLHAVMTMPEGDADYSGRWRAIKATFSRSLTKSGIALTQDRRGEYRLWQRRFWEHTIRDEDDLRAHIDYIHFNPVKHGWASRAADWPYSSFHRFVRLRWLDAEWGAESGTFDGKEFGERP